MGRIAPYRKSTRRRMRARCLVSSGKVSASMANIKTNRKENHILIACPAWNIKAMTQRDASHAGKGLCPCTHDTGKAPTKQMPHIATQAAQHMRKSFNASTLRPAARHAARHGFQYTAKRNAKGHLSQREKPPFTPRFAAYCRNGNSLACASRKSHEMPPSAHVRRQDHANGMLTAVVGAAPCVRPAKCSAAK